MIPQPCPQNDHHVANARPILLEETRIVMCEKCTYLVLEQKADCGNLGSVAGDVVASIEESVPVHSFKVSGRGPERVTEQAIRRLHEPGDARPGVENDPAGARGIQCVQARREGDHVLSHGDSGQANVVKCRQFRVLRQRRVLQSLGVCVAEEDVAVGVRVNKTIREAVSESVGHFACKLRWEGELASSET